MDKLRRTWENLRDQYRRDLKREVRYGFKSKWRFFSDMDFIRDMVSCKENGFKETEFSDSDSELDVGDQLPTTTTTIQGNQKSLVTVTSSSSNTATTSSSNFLTFQPIVLTKQWQPMPPLTAYTNHSTCTTTTTTGSTITTNCDSSQEKRKLNTLQAQPQPQNQTQTHLQPPTPLQTVSQDVQNYETLTKQEPDLDLELEQAAEVMVAIQEQSSSFSKLLETANAREFQEPCVSTSSMKRPRHSLEDNSDSTLASNTALTSRGQVKIEPDLNTKDDDYYFVMSLLPSLRQIPRHRKFPLRIGIMSLIAKDLEEVCKE